MPTKLSISPIVQSLFPDFPYSQTSSQRILHRWFRRLRYQIEGVENIPKSGPVLLIMNHTGWEEDLLTILSAPRPIKFVGLHELLHLDDDLSWERLFETIHFREASPLRRRALRLFGQVIGETVRRQFQAFGMIPMQLSNNTRGVAMGSNGFRAILRSLQAGELVVLFPEGGIQRAGVMRPFRSGLSLLLRHADKLGIPLQVVPAAQHSAGSISWQLGTRYEPRLVYGSPLRIRTANRSPAEFDRWVTRYLQDQVHALLPRAWAGYPLPKQTYHLSQVDESTPLTGSAASRGAAEQSRQAAAAPSAPPIDS